jgi:hypothetical protein
MNSTFIVVFPKELCGISEHADKKANEAKIGVIWLNFILVGSDKSKWGCPAFC